MAYEDLRDFIIEKIGEYDESLLSGDTSRFVSVVIEPIVARLGTDPLSVDIESFIVARIAEEYPGLDVGSPGSKLRDLLLKPLIAILEPIQRSIQLISTQLSASTPELLLREEQDALLGNVFAVRSYGEYAYCVVRVYFQSPRVLSLDETTTFATQDGIGFQPVEPLLVRTADFTRSGNLYYIDANVRSTEATASANVARGEIRFSYNLDGVVRCANVTAATQGVNEETNEEFNERAGRSLTERSLTKKRGIETTLYNYFPSVLSVSVVGYGDEKMTRDVLTVEASTEYESTPGELLYVTGSFASLSAFGVVGAASLPIANTVRLSTAGMTTAEKQAIMSAKFVRVVDADRRFSTPLLGRVREVHVAEEIGAYIYVRLLDFTTVPEQASLSATSTVSIAYHQSSAVAFNQDPEQGAVGSLVCSHGSSTYILGAPLPFSDRMNIVALASPTSVSDPTRDFAILCDTTSSVFSDGTYSYQDSYRVYPIKEFQTSYSARLGRGDYFVLSDRLASASAEYPEDTSCLMGSEIIEVVAYGTPAYLESADADRFAGNKVQPFASNAGVGLQLVATDWGAYTDVTTTAHHAELSLHPDMTGWEDLGVQEGHHIAVMLTDTGGTAYDGKLSGIKIDGTSGKMSWHSWGRVHGIKPGTTHALRVTGLDLTGMSALLAASPTRAGAWDNVAGTFDPGGSQYRLAWTVYKGERTVRTPGGFKYTSYDELQYVGCYGKQTTLTDQCLVAHKHLSGFDYSAGGAVTDSVFNTAIGLGAGRAAWIRLGRSFLEKRPELGGVSAAQMCHSAAFLGLNSADADADLVSGVLSTGYTYNRLLDAQTAVDLGTAVIDAVTQIQALPLTPGSVTLPSVDTAANLDVDGAMCDSTNPCGHSGFLLPFPFGSSASHLIEFFDEYVADDTAATVTVSGMPGSLPYPDAYNGTVEVRSDEVRIGGMVDVYVKAAAAARESTELMYFSHKSTEVDGELLCEGSDGYILAGNTTVFYGPTLMSALSGMFDLLGVSEVEMDNLVLEILGGAFDVTSVRILHNEGAGVRVDGDFGSDGTSVRYRLYRSVTTRLVDGRVTLASGTDMTVDTGSTYVTVPSSFPVDVTSHDLTATALYVFIEAAGRAGEFQVSAISATILTLTTAPSFGSSDAAYQVYTKQAGSAVGVVIRARSVVFGGEDAVKIPARDPVECLASSFAGLNNDPLTDEDFTGANAFTGSPLITAELSVVGADFVAAGVLVGDVVVMDNYPAADTDFYVTAVATTVLTLDRVTVGTYPAVADNSFTIGHPSVGTATIRMLDRTFLELNADTEFSFTNNNDEVVRLRPSTAEFTNLYTNPAAYSDVMTGALSNQLYFLNTDLYALGVRLGDYVYIRTGVLRSTSHTPAAAAAMSVSGKILAVNIDDVQYLVRFRTATTISLADIVDDINDAIGDFVLAEEVITGGLHYLHLTSRMEVQITADSSSGLVSTLGMTLSTDNTTPSSGVGRFEIDVLSYDTATGRCYVHLTSVTGWPVWSKITADVQRLGVQRFYPADFVEDEYGMYTVEATLTTKHPSGLTSAVVSAGQSMDMSGYKSFGYQLQVRNNCYSYSTAEELYLNCTSVVADESATDLSSVYPVPASSFKVLYDRSPEVSGVQSYLFTEERNLCANVLARHYLPAYPVLSLETGGSVSRSVVMGALENHYRSLYPNKVIESYDVAARLSRLGVTRVRMPISVAYLIMDEDRRARVLRSSDSLLLDNRFHIMEDMDYVVLGGV